MPLCFVFKANQRGQDQQARPPARDIQEGAIGVPIGVDNTFPVSPFPSSTKPLMPNGITLLATPCSSINRDP